MRGSFHNRIAENSKQKTPEVGMGATITMYTDRHACTILSVSKSGKEIEVTEDKATRTDNNGMSESQEYAYETMPNGFRETFTLRKNGSWVKKGDSLNGGQRIVIDWRNTYHDYSF
jgi:hypothetical protein